MMELTKKKIIEFFIENKKLFSEKFGVTNISLFGSFARGEETRESDIDLLIEMNDATFDKLAGLKIYLEESFEREVNVVRKRVGLKPRFLKVISRDLIRVA